MFFTHCRNFCNQLVARSRRRPTRIPLARPCVEGLENRNLLSITFSNGTITATGDNGDDTVIAQIDLNGIGSYNDQVVVTRSYGNGDLESKTVNLWKTVPVGQFSVWMRNVTGIVFEARDGHNVFQNRTDIKSWANGGNGYDNFQGGSGIDSFNGFGGSDHLEGRGGDDKLTGEAGNDWLYGGDGNDQLYGGLGADHLYGEAGDDFLSDLVTYGTSGEFSSEGGDDWMYGGDGNDKLYGYSGLDHLYGEAGDDMLRGGSDGQADVLWGGSGNDLFIAEILYVLDGDNILIKNRDQPQDLSPGDGVIW